MLASAAAVRSDFARTITPRLPACLAYQLEHTRECRQRLGRRASPSRRPGAESAVYRATVVVRGLKLSGALLSDYVFFGQGRVEYSLNVVAPVGARDQLGRFELGARPHPVAARDRGAGVSSAAAFVGALLGAIVLAAAANADVRDPRLHVTSQGQAAASAAVLRLGDLGSAWRQDVVAKPYSLKIPVCPAHQPNDGDLTLTGHAESEFTYAAQGIQVDSDAEVFASSAEAGTLFRRMLTPLLPACLRYDIAKSAPTSSLTVGAVKQLAVAKVGSNAAAFRIALAYKVGKREVPVDNDVLFLTQRATVVFVNLIAPHALESELASFESGIATRLTARAQH